MLSNDTCEKLKGMGLEEFLKGLEEQRIVGTYEDMPFEERFSMLIDYVHKAKTAKKLRALINRARFRFKEADANSIIYENRTIDKQQMLQLLTCQFIDTATNLIFVGVTGSGKTFLACAIGKAACRHGLAVFYVRLSVLFEMMATADGTIGGRHRLLNRLSKYDLLIIDEWASHVLQADEPQFMFELIERRYGSKSTIICSQHPVNEWHAYLGGDATAESILDRIVQNSIRVHTGSTNMRQRLSPHPLMPEEET